MTEYRQVVLAARRAIYSHMVPLVDILWEIDKSHISYFVVIAHLAKL